MNFPGQETNVSLINFSVLYPYYKNPGIFKCPSDLTINVRSYGMQPEISSYIGGQQVDQEAGNGIPGYPSMYKENEMKNVPPSSTIIVLEESPQTINDCLIGSLSTGSRFWDVPAARHSRGCNLSFGGGHVEHWKWADPRTVTAQESQSTPNNPDLARIQQDLGGQ